MGDEKKQILQMVADGVISAEDGVKLLEALDKGDRRQHEWEHRSARRVRRHIIAEGLGESLAGIGPMVRTAVCEAFAGAGDREEGDLVFDGDFEGDLEELSGPVDLEDDTVLVIRNRKGLSGGAGDVVLRGGSGGALKVLEGRAEYAIEEDRCFVQTGDADLVLQVPSTVRAVHASLSGVDVSTEDLDAEIDLRSRGGNIDLEGQGSRFCVRTMGGNVRLSLTGSWSASSRASTMGGNILLVIPDGVPAAVTASTVGGDVSVGGDMGQVSESRSHAGTKLRLVTGGGDDPPSIRLKTMGGSIEITGES